MDPKACQDKLIDLLHRPNKMFDWPMIFSYTSNLMEWINKGGATDKLVKFAINVDWPYSIQECLKIINGKIK